MKYIIILLTFFCFLCCKNDNEFNYLYDGNWAVHYLFVNGLDMLGNSESSSYVTKPMVLTKSGNLNILLDYDSSESITAKYKVYKKKDSVFMKIYNSDNQKIDDNYLLNVEKKFLDKNNYSGSYKLNLTSNNNIIYSEKSIIRR